MTEDAKPSTDTAEASPAEAFDNLRREVAFMRRSIERMSDEQRAAPDYSETLGQMNEAIAHAVSVLAWLKRQPAITVTPQEMAVSIKAAGDATRAADRKAIDDASRALCAARNELSSLVVSAQQADAQERQLWWYGGTAAVIGLVFGITLLIAVARLTPEQSAAWIIGSSRWAAGERLLAAADPKTWAELNGYAQLGRDNRAAIADCRKITNNTKKERRCIVIIRP